MIESATSALRSRFSTLRGCQNSLNKKSHQLWASWVLKYAEWYLYLNPIPDMCGECPKTTLLLLPHLNGLDSKFRALLVRAIRNYAMPRSFKFTSLLPSSGVYLNHINPGKGLFSYAALPKRPTRVEDAHAQDWMIPSAIQILCPDNRFIATGSQRTLVAFLSWCIKVFFDGTSAM